MKAVLQRMARPFGFQILADWQLQDLALARHLRAVIEKNNIQQVIEVGTNSGAYGQFLRREVQYHQLLFSLESQEDSFATLQQRAADDALWHCTPFDKTSIAQSTDTPNTEPGLSSVDLDFLPHSASLLRLDNGVMDLPILSALEHILATVKCLHIEIPVDTGKETSTHLTTHIKHFESRGFCLSAVFPITMDNVLRATSYDCVLLAR